MLAVISPAKTLDYETAPVITKSTQPRLLDDSALLIEEARKLAPADISSLMKISDKLGQLNAARFEAWARPFNKDNAKQAVLAFKGDVYTGLDAETLGADEFTFAQQHLRILSGLYGLLRPLDLMQAYRLEMGTKMENTRGKDLYAFWGSIITDLVNKDLKASGSDTLINLASNEYFKAVKAKDIKGEIITPVFKDWKNGQYKIISFYAKKARGMMCRYMVENQITEPEGLKAFDTDGYQYNEAMSSDKEWVFVRKA